MVGVTAGTAVTAGAGADLITVGPSRPVRLPEASWGSRRRPAPPTTAMATRLTTAMATPPTHAGTTDPRITGPSTTAVRITDRSIIAGPTGGLSTTGVRIGGDE